MKEAIFNELSIAKPFSSKEEANKAIELLLQTMKKATELKFNKIRFDFSDINPIILFSNYTIFDWLSDQSVSKIIKGSFQSVMKRPFGDIHTTAYISDNEIWHLNKQEILGLKIAFYLESLSMSFLSEDRKEWDDDFIICDNGTRVAHASHPKHINSHIGSFVKKPASSWQPSIENLFPNIEKEGEGYEWNKNIDFENRDHMIAHTREMGRKVAQSNNWEYDKEISKINTTTKKIRDIYYAGNDSRRMYLSLDVEKYGCFEVCDYRGGHLGEYNFKGLKTKDADSDHDIKVKK